jgi:hypothetical protein
MRFTISSSPGARAIFAVLGIGGDDAHVEVDDATIRVRLGWAGSVTMEKSDIASLQRLDRIPWWLGIGIHSNLFGLLKVWGFTGSLTKGAVRVQLRNAAKGRVLGAPVRATTIYLSLDEPDAFVAASQAGHTM